MTMTRSSRPSGATAGVARRASADCAEELPEEVAAELAAMPAFDTADLLAALAPLDAADLTRLAELTAAEEARYLTSAEAAELTVLRAAAARVTWISARARELLLQRGVDILD